MPIRRLSLIAAATLACTAAQAWEPSIQADARFTYWGIGPTVQGQTPAGTSATLTRNLEQSVTSSRDGVVYTNTLDLSLAAGGQHGTLRASASADLSSFETGVVGDGTSNGGLLMASTSVRAVDVLRIEGLAPGSTAEFTVWAYLHAQVGTNATAICDNAFEPYVPVWASMTVRVNDAYSSAGNSMSASVNACGVEGPVVSQRYTVQAGSPFAVESNVGTSLYLFSSSDDAGLHVIHGFADAGQTGHLWFQLHDPGAVLVAESGTTYLAPALLPVPEPGTWALWALGLAALSPAARRAGRPWRAASRA